MKKTAIILFAVLIGQVTQACDVCGCGALSGGFGYSPYLSSHFIGLSYSRQWYQFDHPVIPGEEQQNGKDIFNTLEIQGRINLGQRIRLYAAMPLKQIHRTEGNSSLTREGLGDIQLFGTYDLWQYRSDDKKNSGILQVGGGLKLPTGSYHFDQETYQSPILQLGTGSIDFLLFSNLSFVGEKLGLNWQNRSSLTTANTDNYRFGNRTDQQVKAYLFQQLDLFSIIPNIGIRYVAQSKDLSNARDQIKNDYSGIQLLMAGVGLDIYRNMMGLSAEFNVPVQSEISNGYVQAKPNFSIQFNYYIKNKKETK